MKKGAFVAALGVAVAIPSFASAQSGVPAQPHSPDAADLALEPPPPAPPPSNDPPPPDPPDPAPAAPSTTPARAKRFGDAATLALSGASAISFNSTSYDGSPAEGSTILVSPGADLFVVDHVSLGIDISYVHAHSKGYAYDNNFVTTDSDSFGAGLRLGVDIPFAAYFSWYLRATVGYGARETKYDAAGSADGARPALSARTTSNGAYLVLYAPLLAHVAPHFFIGFGPVVRQDLSNTSNDNQDVKGTTIGAQLVIGGWL